MWPPCRAVLSARGADVAWCSEAMPPWSTGRTFDTCPNGLLVREGRIQAMRLRSVLLAILFIIPVGIAQDDGQTRCADDKDCDADGLPDRWEHEHFGNLTYTGFDDPDGDGYNNTAEYRDHTDPSDADVVPEADDDAPRRDGAGMGSDRSGRGDGSLADACRDRDDRRDCVRDYCKKHGGDACVEQIRDACDGDCPALRRACDRASDVRGQALCARLADAEDVRRDARHIDFSLDREGRALRNYSVDGVVVFTSIEYADDATGFEIDRNGARIRFETDDSRLEIHDTPTGQFWFRSDDTTLMLTLPPGGSASEMGHGLDIRVDGRHARLIGSDLSVDGDVITVAGHASFASPALGSPRSDAAEAARASQHLGAEIDIAGGSDGIVAYDDVNITLDGDLEQGMRIVLGSELDSGRTFVIDLDADPGTQLNLSYYDIHDDGSETEVVFRMASSMEDVLDPDDDGGQPEYWVFEDADGLHVMVSVPHWSVHAIGLQSLGIQQVAPSVAIGIVAGLMGVGVAAAAMFWPRRQGV